MFRIATPPFWAIRSFCRAAVFCTCFFRARAARPLSYPHVFAWDGAYYMIPECYQPGGARLYRAEEFPHRWTSVATLMERPVLVDSTVFRHDGHWWMFAETNPKHKQ